MLSLTTGLMTPLTTFLPNPGPSVFWLGVPCRMWSSKHHFPNSCYKAEMIYHPNFPSREPMETWCLTSCHQSCPQSLMRPLWTEGEIFLAPPPLMSLLYPEETFAMSEFHLLFARSTFQLFDFLMTLTFNTPIKDLPPSYCIKFYKRASCSPVMLYGTCLGPTSSTW